MDTERNIEVKANLGSDEKFLEKVEIAKKLTNSDGQIIKQHDVFFNAITGRLKLRYLDDAKSQLVQYDRPNVAGPKLSKFNKIEVDDPKLMEKILTDSIGVKGEVKKVRTLFLHEQTRIHLDKVENLGNYLEFEVCLKPTQTIDEGKLIAEKMMEIFGIQSYELMEAAYLDSLLK